MLMAYKMAAKEKMTARNTLVSLRKQMSFQSVRSLELIIRSERLSTTLSNYIPFFLPISLKPGRNWIEKVKTH